MPALARTKKEKAPNWTTYFGRAKKKIRVIYRIIFYAQNAKSTCYCSLKKLSQECGCHVDTVYDAIALAVKIGILAKFDLTTCFGKNPTTAQALFNRRVTLKWLGDTACTAGEEVFDERKAVQNFSTDSFLSSQIPAQIPVKNPAYIKNKESLKKEKETGARLSFTRGELKPFAKEQGLNSLPKKTESSQALLIPPSLSLRLQKVFAQCLEKQGIAWKN